MATIFETAASHTDRDTAVRLIAEAYPAIDVATARYAISAQWRWELLPEWSRAAELAVWVGVDVSDAIATVTTASPMQTVGTND